jgi:urease accessory protein
VHALTRDFLGTLQSWLTVMIADGGGYCDGVFFAHAHRAVAHSDDPALRAVAELATAFAQGRAFLATTRAAWPSRARLAALADGAVARHPGC